MAKANDLVCNGHFVTQIHTRDNKKGSHEMEGGVTAVITGCQEADFIVTSDGSKHNVE